MNPSGANRTTQHGANLIMLHGTRAKGDIWSSYVDLVPHCHVVSPDLPGHGSREDQKFSREAAHQVITEAIEQCIPEVPIVLLGHSLGGYIAMDYVHTYPESVDGLVLVGSCGDPQGPAAAVYRWYATAIGIVGPEKMSTVANKVANWLSGSESIDNGLGGAQSYAVIDDAWPYVLDSCRPEQLREVPAPVLLLNGAVDHMRIDTKLFASYCHDATVATVPKATHLLPVTHPTQTAEHITSFINDKVLVRHTE